MVRIMRKFNLLALLFLIISAVSCSNGNSGSLTGAGATFPLPYYNLMFKQYADSTGIQVNYGGIGSGGGIRSLKDKIVEFAGSDAYLSDEEMADIGAEVIHVPTCMGAVVMAYNIPGVDSLKLSGEIIAGIYSGEITKWNDNRIAGLNDGVKLPDLAITPVYRSDGSGTTFVFTDYLTKVSESWSSSMGRGKSLNWPCGLAAKGNPGVAGIVAQTEGAIGYVGSEYAFALDLKMASVMNRCGNFILPDTGSISAAASGDIPSDMRTMITDSDSEDAYPISCFTWIIVYREQSYDGRTKEQAAMLRDMLKWVLGTKAQALAKTVHYAPVPEEAAEKALALIDGITYEGQNI